MQAFDKVIGFLDGAFESDGTKIVVDGRTLPIKDEFFKTVVPVSGGKLGFVDAGSGLLLEGAGACVGFVRTYGCVWKEKKERILDERFVVVVARGERHLEATIFTKEGNLTNQLQFDAFDPRISLQGKRAYPRDVLSVVRTWLELVMVERLCPKVGVGGVVVRDGDLSVRGELLEEVMENIKSVAKSLNVLVLGIAKTSTTLTDSGKSASLVLMERGPKGLWVFDAGQDVCFIKLHARSKFVFRCDILGDLSLLHPALGSLAETAIDPVFLGYPYGLLDADRLAQVTKQEEEQLRLQFAIKSKERFGQLERSTSAHGILDSL